MKKFVSIEIVGQSNIGVIDLGEIETNMTETMTANRLRERAEPKMVQALREHFDYEIKVRSINVISSVGAIEIKALVIVGAEEEDCVEEVTMSETWVY